MLVRERQRQRITDAELNGRVAPAGASQHALAGVDAVHATVRADLRGHLCRQEARTGADVEHPLTALE